MLFHLNYALNNQKMYFNSIFTAEFTNRYNCLKTTITALMSSVKVENACLWLL